MSRQKYTIEYHGFENNNIIAYKINDKRNPVVKGLTISDFDEWLGKNNYLDIEIEIDEDDEDEAQASFLRRYCRQSTKEITIDAIYILTNYSNLEVEKLLFEFVKEKYKKQNTKKVTKK